MRPRRALREQKRHGARHHSVRAWIEWLTVAFAILCFSWTVVMLVLYEWHTIHVKTK
jgi:hypothetical protein